MLLYFLFYPSDRFRTHRATEIVCCTRPQMPAYAAASMRWYSSADDKTVPAASIDDFRAREEKREHEFNTQEGEGRSGEQQQQQNEEKIKAVRHKILQAALPYVEAHGWSREAISKGAESQGLPGIAHGMFPNGGIELIHYFYQQCNTALVQQLRDEIAAKAETAAAAATAPPAPAEPVVAFVTRALQMRLQMTEPYVAHWPQALAMMSLPQNVPTSLAQLLTMIDDICYYAGDRSVDVSIGPNFKQQIKKCFFFLVWQFNWYTRRVGVATIYKMTELYMLQDASMNHKNTWEFLERRMEEGNQLQQLLDTSEGSTRNVSAALTTAFSTVYLFTLRLTRFV